MKYFLINVLLLLLLPLQINCQEAIRLKTVMIDAGHGGKDPGAVVKTTKEKDITLSVALKLGNYIKENFPDVKVHYTRSTDTFVELNNRAKLANEKKADLFISIHANWISKPEISGTETFVLGLHRSQDNLEVAKKENSVIVMEDDYSSKYEGFDPNSTESYIIFELMQNAYLDQSIHMASLIEQQFTQRAGRPSRGVKQAGFLVLRETAMPSILVELGFLTNGEELKYLTSESGQANLASALFRAFRDYKKDFEAQSLSLKSNGKNEVVKEEAQEVKETKPQSDLVFRIQIKTNPTKIRENTGIYRQFDDIWSYKDGSSYKYTTFHTPSFNEAKAKLAQVRKIIPDAFIVAFEKDKRIALDQALKKLNE